MFEEYEKKKRKQIIFMRSLMDYGMGILFFAVGIFFLFGDKFNIKLGNSNVDPFLGKAFGVISILYGTWRIYRGYKKNYFR